MSLNPPPLPPSGRNLFVNLARVSWISVIVAFGTNMVLHTTATAAPSRASNLINAFACGLIALVGIVSGIIALCGVFRYGRKGLLWPAATGMGLWLLLSLAAVPTVLHARKLALQRSKLLAPPVHSSAATRIHDAEIGFSFDLPDDYAPFPDAAKPKEYRYAFIRKTAGEPSRVLLVKLMGGTIGHQRLKQEQMPAGKSLSLVSFDWRGREIDAIRVPEKLGDRNYVTLNIQVPLRKEGVQLGLGGPAESEPQLRLIAERVLASLEGESD